ncbi:phytanoyl-CoA dioxygenase family protein [Nocardioides sp. zg-ZUI104]|uniref:phytanoyl-CoA dioxygenase family protein n=1 Tax=Nocardioides faecalis TaxID=2803858 RepID=UPI001BCC82BD|nr:phytanoyl-CoA dioxygenase family protein [Nocardioides faecalis]MBS4752779.1 phytanoyl-CoA dioxygenase family protein [Nocardioides faecalis]
MSFAEDGFDVWRGGLPLDLVTAAGNEIRDFFAAGAGGSDLETDLRPADRGLERVFNIQSAVPETARLWTNTRLLEQAATLIGVESLQVFYTQAILKHPMPAAVPSAGHGIIGWHQDFAYWRGVTAPRMLTAWIPFAAVEPDGGGVVYRHRTATTDSAMLKGFNNVDLATASGDAGPSHGPSLDIGDVAFHHCLTPHASLQNRSKVSRLALAVHLLDVALLPIDLSRCHHSLAFLGG